MTGTGHDLQHRIEETLHEIEEHIPFYLRRWWRWPAIALASIVVPIALGLLAFRLIAPTVPGYKAEVESRASAVIGFPVAIDDMYLSWYWFGPEVVLRQVRVLGTDGAGELLRAGAVRVAVSPLDFARGGPWRPGRVLFEKPVLTITVTPDQRLLLGGAEVGDLTAPTGDWRDALDTLLTHGHLEARELDLVFDDQRRLEGPLAFRADLALDTDGEDHELELTLQPPPALGDALHLEAVAHGVPREVENWTWDAEVSAEGVQVGWLRAQLGAADSGFDGRLDLDGEIAARSGVLERVTGRVRMGDLRAAGLPRATDETAAIAALESGVDWRRTADGWTLELDRLQVRRGARVWQPGGIALDYVRDATGGAALSGEAGFLRVEDLELIASWLPPSVFPIGSALHEAAPRGEVSGLRFRLGLADARVLDWSVRAEFAALGVAANGRVPGVTGLRGSLVADGSGGELTLDAPDVAIDFGGLFRKPLAAENLAARLAWSRETDGWTLRLDDLRWRSPDVRVAGRGVIRLPDDGGAPVVDLTAEVEDAVSTHLGDYLPIRALSPQVVAYLERSIVRGRAPRGEFALKGPLDRFPFRDGDGLFRIAFHVDDAIFEYAEGWPRAEAITADVTFLNQGLEIQASHAEVMGAQAREIHVLIPDLHQAVVAVNAKATATAEQGQAYLAASPLEARMGGYLEAVSVSGPMEVGLDLLIPAHADAPPPTVDVRATLAGARVAVNGFPLVAEQVAGELRFTADSIASDALTGVAFGAPFSARIGAAPSGVDALARIAIDGGAEVRTLTRALGLPLDRFMQGRAALRADIDLPRGAEGGLAVGLRSDLKGLAVDLPAPFGKPADTATAVKGALRFGGDALEARIDYSGGSSAQFAFQRERRAWRLAPGEAAAHVTVVAPAIDLDAWLTEWTAVIGRPAPRAPRRAGAANPANAAAQDATALPLRRLDLRARTLTFLASSAEDATLTARRDGAGWQVEVSGSTLAGSAIVPDDRATQPIALDMERLWIAEDAANATPAAPAAERPPVDPRGIPGFIVHADSLRIAGADYGKVDAVIEKRPAGLYLTKFEGVTLTHRTEGTGSWEWVDGASRTALAGKLVSTDLRVTLTALGVFAPIESERGRLEADVHWPGEPWRTPFARMAGSLKLKIGRGQLLDVAPGGTGRFVGLLSLSALPRRLRLDFSDVFRKGFAFDSIEGEFVVEDGNAYTDGAVIKGPAATVTVLGRTGLETRDYDQLAVVDAGLGSTLPVAGAIAGGLTGGAVMLLFSQVFKSPLKDATRARYRITGPWGDPKIEQVASKDVTVPTAPQAVKP